MADERGPNQRVAAGTDTFIPLGNESLISISDSTTMLGGQGGRVRHMWMALVWSGCCLSAETLEGLPFLQDEPAVEGPVSSGLRFEAKKRESLLAKANHGFNEPAIGLVKSQCDDVTAGGPIDASGCTTATLTCNETLIGHTVGGVDRYDSRFYERGF